MNKELRGKIINLMKEIEGGCVFFEDKERIAEQILKLVASEKEELLKDLLKFGHGGGNWRRLIISKLEGLNK